jgi:hypothetical protein
LKVRDIRHAVDFLAKQPAIDGGRLGVLGICASSMYAALAAVDDSRLRALALIAPWIHDAALVREVYGGEQGVRERLDAAERAAERYERTGVVEYVPVADAGDPRAAMPMEIDFYTNPERGRIAGWPNRFAVMAWREWLTLDVIARAPDLRAPTLIVHSHDAAIPEGAQRFYNALAAPKEIVWMAGTQFDFYDQETTVGRAITHATRHFDRHLAPYGN